MTRRIDRGTPESGATFSPCERYRYQLWRRWHWNKPLVIFIGLNPSTADELQLDPTLRRIQAFAQRDGFGGFLMLNLFAWRSTDPKALLAIGDPVGPGNDELIELWLRNAACVACWGNHRVAGDRAAEVLGMARRLDRRLSCLGTNRDGSPRHPLYLPKITPIIDLPENRCARIAPAASGRLRSTPRLAKK